jgi:hypothetical protein
MKIVSLASVAAAVLALTPLHSAEAQDGRKSADNKPLRVTVDRGRRIGGYSYNKLDGISAQQTRRFIDPPRQSLGGPFDNGFFFVTPTPPYGGYSPYMH